MKKTMTAVLASTLIAISIVPANADLKPRTISPSLAILDTALDTSIPSIKSNLVGEVCILDWSSCPNKKSFMEGPGSSVLPIKMLLSSNFNHGTQMVSAALLNNPNLNIVFVRIFGNTKSGERQSTGINTVVNALNWVKTNKDKYNIVAVSLSQGAISPVINKSATSNYCVATALDPVISSLYSMNIPVFFPAGNSAGQTKMAGKIEWPACIKDSIAIGGVETLGKPSISLISNYDSNLIDLWGEIRQPTIYPGNIPGYSDGTSVSNQVIAAKYVALKTSKPLLTLNELISLMKISSDKVENNLGQNVFLFNLDKAING